MATKTAKPDAAESVTKAVVVKAAHVWLRQREAAAYCAHPFSTFRRDYTGQRVEKRSTSGKRMIPYYRTDWLDAWMERQDGQRRRSA